MIFNLYIANHGKRDGIEDFITLLNAAVTTRGHEAKVTSELDAHAVNVIIDEFTNAIRNEEIATFKQQYPNARVVLVLTEFIERRLGVCSFNFFSGPLDAAVIAALNIYLRLRRKDFLPPTLSHWLIAVAYSPMGLVYYLDHLRRNLRRRSRMRLSYRIHGSAYMLMRYLGLEKMISLADGLVLSHGMIAEGLEGLVDDIPVLGTVHPELNLDDIRRSIFHDKQLFVEITGSVTPYRQRFIEIINGMIEVLGLKNCFRMCHSIAFSATRDNNAPRGAYSLHPPQTRGWKYCSPTRIFRALQYDHNMPVLTKVFEQHPIEKLCLEFKGDETLFDMYRYYKNPEKLMEYLEPRMREYMGTARRENDAIVAAMAALRPQKGLI